MNISLRFDDQPWAEKLERRRLNFRYMCEHVEKFQQGAIAPPIVVETGTAWDKDNWAGQGQSTLVWDWLAGELPDLDVISIDIRKEASETARAQTKNIDFRTGESVKTLNEIAPHLKTRIALLYLDSFDWTPELNLQSALHHLAELTTVWALLPNGCMVVVDDRHGNGKGKHWIVEEFMRGLGIDPVFKNHQIGWVKP